MEKLRDYISVLLSPLKIVYGWLVFHFYFRLPLEKKVVFSCFSGKRYGDSPKYVSEMLHEKHPDIKQIWIYNKNKLVGVPKYVHQVKRHSLEMMRELATAKVWVDSHYQPCWVFKRKDGQFFIQTWHGGIGFKKIGLEAEHKVSFVERMRMKDTAKKVDVWVTDSDWSVRVHREANNYKGKFLKIGLPKIDFMIKNKDKSKERVHDFYKIPNNKKIVFYAPTMRKIIKKGDFDIKVQEILDSLARRFGGDWIFILRMHPVNQDIQKKIIELNAGVYDGLKYGDMQDMIAAADVFISDYSSAVFDSAILEHPTFCFAFDEDRYCGKERGFYQKPEDLPFPIARTEEELCKEIEKFDEKVYKRELKNYYDSVGLFEPNGSTEKVVEIIAEKMYG